MSFAPVQAFKGMESPAVIYCDVDRVETQDSQSLLYVGMSRARRLLVMMVHERMTLGRHWSGDSARSGACDDAGSTRQNHRVPSE